MCTGTSGPGRTIAGWKTTTTRQRTAPRLSKRMIVGIVWSEGEPGSTILVTCARPTAAGARQASGMATLGSVLAVSCNLLGRFDLQSPLPLNVLRTSRSAPGVTPEAGQFFWGGQFHACGLHPL